MTHTFCHKFAHVISSGSTTLRTTPMGTLLPVLKTHTTWTTENLQIPKFKKINYFILCDLKVET